MMSIQKVGLMKTNKNVEVSGNDVNITVHSADLSGTVNVTLYSVNEVTGLFDKNKTESLILSSRSSNILSTTFDLSSASAMNVYVDKNNKFVDDDKNDNFVYRVIVQNRPKTYLSINTSYPDVDSLIRTYLKQYVVSVSENNADLIISVGKNTQEFKDANPETLKSSSVWWWKEQGWGFETGGIVAYDGKPEVMSYSGLVGRTEYNDTPLVLAYGNRIDGDIASVKKLISARELFFVDLEDEEKPPVVLDKYDTLALGVNDLLRSFINYSSANFLKVVDNILFDNSYDISIRTVKTLNQTSYGNSTILRLKNVNSDYGEDFKDAITEHENPVVLSHGIHSDLLSWEDFGKDLASSGFDAWLIEAYGGPTTEDCNYGCPNYNFNDLKSYYWPALIAGVQEYSGKDNLSYVGYDLGCTMALESLESFGNGGNDVGYYFDYDSGQYKLSNLSSDPIETFVGVGCIGNFTSRPFFIEALHNLNENLNLLDNMKNKGKTHITMNDIKSEIFNRFWYLAINDPVTYFGLRGLLTKFLKGSKMSIEIYSELIDWMDNSDKPKIGENVKVDKSMIIEGKFYLTDSDTVVPNEDTKQVCKNINSSNKHYVRFDGLAHTLGRFSLPTHVDVKDLITLYLKNESLDKYQNKIISTSSDCE